MALRVRDIEFHPSGTGQTLIRRSKMDAEGQGEWPTYREFRETAESVAATLDYYGGDGISAPDWEGADWRTAERGEHGANFQASCTLDWMPEHMVQRVSGHSTRVGATQDLAALDIDLAATTQAGGWNSTRMPLHYAEKINAARSGMARAADSRARWLMSTALNPRLYAVGARGGCNLCGNAPRLQKRERALGRIGFKTNGDCAFVLLEKRGLFGRCSFF